MTPPPTAILGASGFLGAAFRAAYAARGALRLATARQAGLGLAALDYRSPELDALDFADSRWALLLGAVTTIRACAEDPRGSWAVNVGGPLRLIEQLTARDVRAVVFSTDYVFDGELGDYATDATPSPTTVYGQQKAELEERALRLDPRTLVVRLGKVYGTQRGDGTLLDELARELSAGRVVRAARDQVLCPIHVDDVVAHVAQLTRDGCAGRVHVCGRPVTRYELALQVADALRVSKEQVRPIALHELQPGRPLNPSLRPSVLASTELGEALERLAAQY